MKNIFALAIFLGLAVALATPGLAETPLTQAQIQSTIATMRDLRPIMEKNREELEKLVPEDERDALAKDPCVPPPSVKSSAAYREMEGTVQAHGFANGEEWCRVAQRITGAYAAVKLDEEEPQWREKMGEARKQIESAPNLTPEQRTQLLDQLEETSALVGSQNVSDADKAVVKANIGEIEKAIQELYPTQQ